MNVVAQNLFIRARTETKTPADRYPVAPITCRVILMRKHADVSPLRNRFTRIAAADPHEEFMSSLRVKCWYRILYNRLGRDKIILSTMGHGAPSKQITHVHHLLSSSVTDCATRGALKSKGSIIKSQCGAARVDPFPLD